MPKPSSNDHFFCPAILVRPGDPEPLEWRRAHPDYVSIPVTIRDGAEGGRQPNRPNARNASNNDAAGDKAPPADRVPATPGRGTLPAFNLPAAPSVSEFKAIHGAASPSQAAGPRDET